ncbi:uncharacterized protein LOC132388673, partial [Hypanus sabinus]|uniref:uncharacterized protein LOC132388673 n=1 Tax=Hypanus sabinus TaxID=79690 RepID=UPI0028C4E745
MTPNVEVRSAAGIRQRLAAERGPAGKMTSQIRSKLPVHRPKYRVHGTGWSLPAGGAFFHSDGSQEDNNQLTSVRVRMDTDLNSTISAFLSKCEDHHLFRLTRFYMERLEQAIEEGLEGVGSMLMGEDHFTGREYHGVTELAEKGNRAGASKLLLDLVMEKGSGARRVMWESFVKLHHHLPKLSGILNEIRERGDGQFVYMDRKRSLPEMPKHLK